MDVSLAVFSSPGFRRTLEVILLVVVVVGGSADAQENPNPQLDAPQQIPLTTDEIRIDGVLDEAVWDQAWTYELGFEVRPGENIPAPVRTEVRVVNTKTHLYVGFRAWDPSPEKIRAHLSDRDNAWSDDWVGVVLDTFDDQRRNYLLVVNPLGVQMDNIETGGGGSTVWDGIWDAAATITDWGWSAEIKVPFSTLRFQRSSSTQVWGFDAIRGYPRNVSRQMGAFARDRDNNCYLCQAIKIEGFEGISPGKNLEVVPTLTAARYEERGDFPDGPFDVSTDDLEFGITARWGFTPNLTVAGTVNPDFSQVEADARQLDINQPFALFYPEKRPFFMEGADYFETRLDAVYTRMIRDPAWGAKLTGKEGPNTVGGYVVEDSVTNIIFPGSQSSDATSLAMSNTSTVLRYKRDIDSRFTLGALITDREGDDYFNRVAGFDGDFKFSPQDEVWVQALWSNTRYPHQVAEDFDQATGDFDDFAVDLLYSHSTRVFSFWGFFRDVGKDFRADLGFMPQVDYRVAEVGADYTWIGEPGDWYSQMLLIGKYSYSEDHDGDLLNEEYAVRFNYEGPLQMHAFIRPSHEREGYSGSVFDLDNVSFHFCLKPDRHSHFWLNSTIGDSIDYTNVRPGDRFNIDTGFWYRLGRHLYLEPHFTFEEMNVEQGRLYQAKIGQFTASWQFTARAFVRAILQNVDYEYNVALYSDDREPEYRNLFTQLLFSYKLNPRTVFFLGYSDNSFATQDYELTRANRTVFAKIGYAFVL